MLLNIIRRSKDIVFSTLPLRTKIKVHRILFSQVKNLRTEFKKEVLHGEKTGRIYRIRKGNQIVDHQASAPGETPAEITGNYRKSVGTIVRLSEIEFGNTAVYARALELGDTKINLLPRPGLFNAIVASQRDILRDLSIGISEETLSNVS